jgi:hypothetical protein
MDMKNVSQLTLLDGEVVPIQLGYNPRKCMMIARDFPEVNKIFSFSMKGNDVQTIEFATLAGAVYVAYRQANMQNYLTFDQFFDEEHGYDFDMKEASQIYTAMLDQKAADKYIKEVQKLAGKPKKGK